MLENLFGGLTFVLFTTALLPQIVIMVRIKSSHAVSKLWPTVAALACLSGLIYLNLQSSEPPIWILIDYSLGLILNSLVLILSFIYCGKRQQSKKGDRLSYGKSQLARVAPHSTHGTINPNASGVGYLGAYGGISGYDEERDLGGF